jgi:RHS repeat-associated protein
MAEDVETGSAGSTSSAPSPFSAPQINLPKGGGAIRGMGEKFSANAVTGTGSLSIPIAVSSARSGFNPQLSLQYDSGAGNGAFGIGWSVSMPAITRKTDKGLPQYRDYEESDVFILSGAEDLVPVLRQEGGHWVNDEYERDGYAIKLYRPRIDGLFARIERWTRIQDGDIHWRSFSKDNVLTLYGNTDESRICDPANRKHIFSWLISASFDGKGNAILYEHVPENDCGIDLSLANERNRTRTANRYPKRILYGNRKPFRGSSELIEEAAWMFEIVFDYGEEEYRSCAPDSGGDVFVEVPADLPLRPWPVRKDPFSTYRSGFEVRTYRLCRRVLMFHRFPEELETPRYLVRSTGVEYEEKRIGSFLTRAIQSGYTREAEGRYLKKSMPALELGYSPNPLEHESFDRFAELKDAEAQNLPQGIDGENYRWLDLDGVGISGVLSEQGTGWYYKRNLGQGRFGATELVAKKPSIGALASGTQQLLDIVGDGNLDLVEFETGQAGFYERTTQGAGWEPFRAFRSMPVVEWDDPNLKFVDVTGDGIADVLITEDIAFRWHPSYLRAGFGEERRIPAARNEEQGPRIVFDDGTQSIYLADMSGDGLSDIVRIRNGEVCYWPNIGYGCFGFKITMDNSPWFDLSDKFDQKRVRLADTDGSGTTDIVYLGAESVQVYLNESGNGWSTGHVLKSISTGDLTAISVTDFLGRGTSCVVWSSPLPSDGLRPLRYVDLMRGQKPHLLTRVSNNLGAETTIEYASSTEFYLADEAAGRPWVTRLPFPVHVVKRIVTYDAVSRNRFVSRKTYHHGYYDGVEREFRGFGRVEQLDTEEFGALTESGALPPPSNEQASFNVPPVLTKTWYHTGVFIGGGRVSRHLAHEYYREPHESSEMLLDDTILPAGLMPEEAREACRSLKGSMLRQEVYALDSTEESSRPYTASESNFTIRPLQPQAWNRYAVFFTHAREALTFNYERKLYKIEGVERADPRVGHSITLQVDEYGNVLQSVSIGYGRRFPENSGLPHGPDQHKQKQLLLTLAESDYTNAVCERDAYRTPLSSESRAYELYNFKPQAHRFGVTNLFRFEEMQRKVAAASDGHHDLPYEDQNGAGSLGGDPCRRLFQRSRIFYRSDNLEHLLPLGVLQSLALPGRGFQLAFTPGVVRDVYRRKRPEQKTEDLLPDPNAVLKEGGYVDLDHDGHWWIPSGRLFYSPDPDAAAVSELAYARRHFFTPRRFQDPFGNTTLVTSDVHDLTLVQSRDAAGNTITSLTDYRVLAPKRVTDANRNRVEASFDALGLVTGTAIMGKQGDGEGDSLDGFVTNLSESAMIEQIRHPLRDPANILQGATTRFIYDLFAFMRTRGEMQPQPAVTYTLARETHLSDLAPGRHTKIQHLFTYSDGFGRVVQGKGQTAPGPLEPSGPEVNPRWIGNGWTIFNNKGKPVRKYEPFFTAAHEFEFANIVGVTATLFYDPVERVIATLHPEHTYEKVVFDPWRQVTWDVNDTVLERDPSEDPDVGSFFRRIPDHDYLPTWYELRRNGGLGEEAKKAAEQTVTHAGTFKTACLDTLGRTFLMIDINRFKRDDQITEELIATSLELDIEGRQLSLTDALNRRIVTYAYDLLSNRIHQFSADAGERWNLVEIAKKPLRTWDSRGYEFRYEYDMLRRQTAFFVRHENAEKMVEKTIYGEGQHNDLARNLRAQVFQQLDGAGLAVNQAFDFKGNLLHNSNQLLFDYHDGVDWAGSPELEERIFDYRTTYDALDRTVRVIGPDRSVIHLGYNEASSLDSVDVNLRGAETVTSFVKNITYNPKLQRELIAFGNASRTRYSYDPLTFRLMRLETRRAFDEVMLQDLRYTYDPVGNITHIADHAQQKVYFDNQVVSASNDYVYDAIYRLIGAQGRELVGLLANSEVDWDDGSRMNQPLPADGQAMRRYTEAYCYDMVGNILDVIHHAADGGWKRHNDYSRYSNRLERSHVGKLEERYSYDADGNMIRMPHLPLMSWDFKNQLHMTREQVVNHGEGQRTFFAYDSAGQRVRKVTERPDGSKAHERIYLAGFEIYREYHRNKVSLERETLHVMDDKRRVALVETKTVDAKAEFDHLPQQRIRYQFTNHLDSSCLELDGEALVISYEEYYPYGSTSYESVRKWIDISPKRYRYTGKERDQETGLYYHCARYYISWLGRWTAPDPSGLKDGPNLFGYCSDNPVIMHDPNGTDGEVTTTPAEDEAQACLVDPSTAAPTAAEEAAQQSIPSEHPQASAAPSPAPSGGQGQENTAPQWELGPRGEHIPTKAWTGGPLRDSSEYDKPYAQAFAAAGNYEAAELAQNYLCATCHVLTQVDPRQFSLRGYVHGWERAYIQGFIEVPLRASPIGAAWETGVSTGQVMTGEGAGLHISNISSYMVEGQTDLGHPLTASQTGWEAGGAALGWLTMGLGAAVGFSGGGGGEPPNPFADLSGAEIDAAIGDMSSQHIFEGPVSATEAGFAVEDMAQVSRWGRPGLKPGDWVMNGPPNMSNYIRSFKWDPNPLNTRAPFSVGEGYILPPSQVTRPTGWGLDGWFKGLFGQRKYTP